MNTYIVINSDLPLAKEGLGALFDEHGILIEVESTLVRLVCDGLVEVGSWGMVGKYMPIEEAEELLFGGSD